MKVIVISGRAQNGKDSTANFIKDALEESGKCVLITHYGDLLKYICKEFFGWNGEKDEYGRSLLQRIGTNCIRKKDPDYWVNFTESILKLFPETWDYVLIPDCRFPNEIEHLKSEGFDVTHLRVVRENFESPLTAEQRNHPSETALDGVEPDCYVMNDGTLDDLREKAIDWVIDELGYYQLRFKGM